MRYRVYNEKNIGREGYPMAGHIFAHYTKTKREAIEYGETVLGGNYIVERKLVSSWVKC